MSIGRQDVDIYIGCRINFIKIWCRAFVVILTVILVIAYANAGVESRHCSLQQVPVTIDGKDVHLQMRIYKPAKGGKFPTLVLNHGSTGSGMVSARFRQPIDHPTVASFFYDRGWAIVIPARRGRAASGGKYDEGFSIIRKLGYTCFPTRSIAGADRALRDIEAAMTAILDMPFVDRDRVAIGGVSRGGILSVAYAGAHQNQVRAVINFVGGWLGWPCPTMRAVNQSLFNRGSAYPGESIWLYADNDSYYSLSHSRENFKAFLDAGGRGVFHDYVIPASNGHRLPAFQSLWAKDLETYLERVGFENHGHGTDH